MKKKIFISSVLVTSFILCSLIESCKKNDKPSNAVIGNWRMTAYIHNGLDVYGTQVGSCVIDDIITFTSDLQVIDDEGPTKCNSSDPQTSTGTYSLNSDNTQLTVLINGDTEVNYIRILNSTTLKLEQFSNGDMITYTRIP